jgi:CheY-like chemotaxis protein
MFPKILVVEDVPDWRITLGGILKEEGFLVDFAGSTREAKEALTHRHYDLALLDIRLDESNENDDEGLILANEIGQSWPEVKVIFVTGYATKSFIERALSPRLPGGKRLAVNFVTKDDISKLIEIIRQALS